MDKPTRVQRLTRILLSGAPVWMVFVALTWLLVQGRLELDPIRRGCHHGEEPSFALFLALGPVAYLVPVCGQPLLPIGEAPYCPVAALLLIALIAWIPRSRLELSWMAWGIAMVGWMVLGASAVVLHGFM